MKTMKLFTVLFLTMGILTTSCKKGDMGDPGPIGENGAAGEAGEQGVQGEKGDEGNANIIASAWIDTQFDTANPSSSDQFSISVPELTREIADNSILMIYGRKDNPSGFWVRQLPYVVHNQKYDFVLIGNLLHEYELNIFGVTMNDGVQTFGSIDKVRYVIIPSATSTSKSTIDIKKMSYEEVMDHFGLDY